MLFNITMQHHDTRDKVDCFIDTSIYPGSLKSTFEQNLIINNVKTPAYKIGSANMEMFSHYTSIGIITSSHDKINNRLPFSSRIAISKEIGARETYASFICLNYVKACEIDHSMSMILV